MTSALECFSKPVTFVSQANDPIFCVVADRSFRVGSLVGGTGVHSQLGDDLMSDGGLGVEWRITAEAVTTSLQQGKQNNMPSHSCTHPLARSHHRQTRTSTLKHTHTHTHTHTHPHTRTHTNTDTGEHTHTKIDTGKHAHAHTHSLTHTRTHTPAHKHTQNTH